MNWTLQELREQREMVSRHLAWLENKIAECEREGGPAAEETPVAGASPQATGPAQRPFALPSAPSVAKPAVAASAPSASPAVAASTAVPQDDVVVQDECGQVTMHTPEMAYASESQKVVMQAQWGCFFAIFLAVVLAVLTYILWPDWTEEDAEKKLKQPAAEEQGTPDEKPGFPWFW